MLRKQFTIGFLHFFFLLSSNLEESGKQFSDYVEWVTPRFVQ